MAVARVRASISRLHKIRIPIPIRMKKRTRIIHFYNNTLIQHKGSLNQGILWIIFTAESSGMEGGELVPGTVFLTNNFYVLDRLTPWDSIQLLYRMNP